MDSLLLFVFGVDELKLVPLRSVVALSIGIAVFASVTFAYIQSALEKKE